LKKERHGILKMRKLNIHTHTKKKKRNEWILKLKRGKIEHVRTWNTMSTNK
jgi:hypothetical protein